MRLLCMLLVTSAATVMVACTNGAGMAALPQRTSTAGSATPASSTAVSSPTSSTAPVLTRGQIDQRLSETMLSDDDLAGQGLKASSPIGPYTGRASHLLFTCNMVLRSNDLILAVKEGEWSTKDDSVDLIQESVYYTFMSGAEAIDENRRNLTCDTYIHTSTNASGTSKVEVRVTGEIATPPAAGVDNQYAFCEQITNNSVVICTLLLARGSIVTATVVFAPYASTARQVITKITPLLAEALARAS